MVKLSAEETALINAARNRREAIIDREAAKDGLAIRNFIGIRRGRISPRKPQTRPVNGISGPFCKAVRVGR